MERVHPSQHSVVRESTKKDNYVIFWGVLPKSSILSAQWIFAEDLGQRYGRGERVQDFL